MSDAAPDSGRKEPENSNAALAEKSPADEAQNDDQSPPSTGSSEDASVNKKGDSDDETLSLWKLVPISVALCATLFCTSLVSCYTPAI